jgi:hypothetical protein
MLTPQWEHLSILSFMASEPLHRGHFVDRSTTARTENIGKIPTAKTLVPKSPTSRG